MRKKLIDKLDLEILRILQEDASITNKELSKKLGITEPPTLVRVKNLRELGVLKKYKIEINPEFFGSNRKIIYYLKASEEGRLKIIDTFHKHPYTLTLIDTYKEPITNLYTLFTIGIFYSAEEEESYVNLFSGIPGIIHFEKFHMKDRIQPWQLVVDDRLLKKFNKKR